MSQPKRFSIYESFYRNDLVFSDSRVNHAKLNRTIFKLLDSSY